MTKFEMLDCTFRDGGYYSNWHFPDNLVRQWARLCKVSGVRYFEIGFRHPEPGAYKGPFAYSTPQKLGSLALDSPAIAIMLNASDFVDVKNLGATISRMFPDIESNHISMVRVALHLKEAALAADLVGHLSQMGIQVASNLMQISSMQAEDAADCLAMLENAGSNFLYFADSSGSLRPREVKRIAEAVSEVAVTSQVGFHGHDNLGLAVENSLSALEGGATIVDGTALGLGRGAGNAATEKLLAFRESGSLDNLKRVFSTIEKDFRPRKRKYEWGEHSAYFLAGMTGMHSGQVQAYLQTKNVSTNEVLNFVIPSNPRVQQVGAIADDSISTNLQAHLDFIQGRDILILGTGAQARENQGELEEFARKQNLLICKAGRPDDLGEIPFDICCLSAKAVQSASTDWQTYHGKYLVGLGPDDLLDPTIGDSDEVGTVALENEFFSSTVVVAELVRRVRPKNVWIAGLDGYESSEAVNAEVALALMGMSEITNLTSLTKTIFDVNVVSVHALL